MDHYIVLGGTGHVGRAVATALLKKSLQVTIVTSDFEKVADIEAMGAKAAVTDIRDTPGLKRIFKTGNRLFLLNPPAAPATNTVAEEQKNVQAILAALPGSELEWIVAESTYGAQPGGQIGDLGVLYQMEQGLKDQPVPFTILRGAYYFTNWDALLQSAMQGQLTSVYPVDFKLPMVAPEDIGHYAAELLTAPEGSGNIHFVEGPERYSPAQVAAAFEKALGKPVKAIALLIQDWMDYFRKAGFSEAGAQSMVNMSMVTIENKYDISSAPHKGAVTLEDYIKQLVLRNG